MAPANLTLEVPGKLMTVDEFWDFVHLPANDATILADVVSIKEELERIREQVENVE